MKKEYFLAWPVMVLMFIMNGMLRVFVYGPMMSELTAHQISTVTGLILLTTLLRLLFRRYPLAGRGEALLAGSIWLLMTVTFEFGFGHFVAGHSWDHLLRDYDLSSGRLWALIPLWTLAAPSLIYLRGKSDEIGETADEEGDNLHTQER